MDLQLIIFVIIVGLFTAVAAISDFRTRKIPNKLTVPVFVLGLIYQAAFNGWSGNPEMGLATCGLKSALLGFLVGFGTLFLLWMIGGGGGGDVKLMGALSVWIGFRLTVMVMIASTAFVLLGTVTVMAWSILRRGPWKTKEKYVANSKNKHKESMAQRQNRRVMAYAIPVALATWVIVIWKLPII